MIDANVKMGRNVRIYNPDQVNIFGCEIGDGSFVGPFVEITRGVVIGRDCKIESHSFLCTDVIVEDEVFIGHGVMFTNDLYPRVERQVAYLPIHVGKGVSIGSNATLVAGVTIGEYAVIGAGAVVTKDVPPYSIVAGNPAQVIREFSTYEKMLEYMNSRQALRVSS
ncbi:MAG: N-acetyltransferase [Anaerolineales bacterium]|nr:N-acetyltransferase [Anaerolineales bacterium]